MGGGLAAGVGAGLALSIERQLNQYGSERLPLGGGYAAAGDGWHASGSGLVRTIWHVPTTKPWVALTFDDGPGPKWTPRVLDALDRADAQATFFVVGKRLVQHAAVVRDRLQRHEVGNHTWSHCELGKLDAEKAFDQLDRCHNAIKQVLGRDATLMRPPWGHLGGAALVAADRMGYDVTMWSYVMPEQNPDGLVDDVCANAKPGSILLAHDVGRDSRLAVVDRLDRIVAGLRAAGLELVTVSQLMAARSADASAVEARA
ncbi:hypothetical protein Rhe02_16370 [Rhizocola hellebori]|uniref:NodB homology domain-containing protein n=2 Tax=Rhizocola hellebori TaxID=1392758 RepID=A0A8J3Q4B0_9ACTN|nr:hypothetical protein Rhe02_16370 [Rhizocola hellebori]